MCVKLASLLLEEPAPSLAINPDDSQKLVAKFSKSLANRKGIDTKQLKQVGVGTRGTAYSVGNDKVLKVTADDKEALASLKLVGQDLPSVVRIFDVWRFGDTGFYGIYQESLVPLSKPESDRINNALLMTLLPVWIAKNGYNWEVAKTKTIEYVVYQMKRKFGNNTRSPEAIAYMKQANEDWNLLSKTLNLRGMLESLASVGISYHDFHAGNLMKRQDGTTVLIDLGLSKIAGGKPPPVLMPESFVSFWKRLVKESLAFDPKILDGVDLHELVEKVKQQPGVNLIDTGSSRAVFKIDNDKVLKVAINKEGLAQNRAEVDLITHPRTNKLLFTDIYDYSTKDYRWILSEYAGPLNLSDDEMEDILGFHPYFIIMFITKFKGDLSSFKSHVETNYQEEGTPEMWQFFGSLLSTTKATGLLIKDLAGWRQWGITADNRIVIVDYGLDKAAAKLYNYTAEMTY